MWYCSPSKRFAAGNIFSKTQCLQCKILAHHIRDTKYVTLLSTTYNAEPVLTGKLHWQTNESIESPKTIIFTISTVSSHIVHLDRPVHKD